MNTIEIRELTDAEMEQVSGGWKFCTETKNGGGTGLYPDYVECGVYTNADFVRDIMAGRA